MDGVAEVEDFDFFTGLVGKDYINSNTYKSPWWTNSGDIFSDGSYSKEIRFDLKSSVQLHTILIENFYWS